MSDLIEGPDCGEPSYDTQTIIKQARRPMMIARHREVVEDMEGSLSDRLVTGTADNPRLQAMLREIEAASEQARVQQTLDTLLDDPHVQGLTLQEALVEHCCLLRENAKIEIAALQMHIIAVYRRIRGLINEQQGMVPNLKALRTLPIDRLPRLLHPIELRFGSVQLMAGLVIAPAQAEEVMRHIKRISRAEGGDRLWREAAGDPPLPREIEAPLQDLPEDERRVARERLVSDRVRSLFYRNVFLSYFDCDTLGPEEIEAHRSILHWIESIEETPHLYPFMQGQTPEQKQWRLANLLRKIIQLNEVYQRIAQASEQPEYQESFADLSVRERLGILARDRYPALKVDAEFTLATLVCPFRAFAAWVQERVAAKDFVLPQDPRG